MPIVSALAKLLVAVLGKAFEVLAGLWQNVLWPALKKLWEFLSNDMKPIWDKVALAVQKVVEWIEKLTEKIKNIKLPEWLQRHSPSPFEMTFIGAGEAIKKMARVELPRLSAQLQTVPIGIGAGGSTTNDNRSVTTGDVNIGSGGMSAQSFDRMMRDWIGA